MQTIMHKDSKPAAVGGYLNPRQQQTFRDNLQILLNSSNMKSEQTIFIRRKTSVTMLLLGVLVFIFWLTSRIINVYHFPFVGAIFELLWLPLIALTLVLPVLSFLSWRKEHFSVRSLNLYALLVVILTIFLTVFEV